MSLRLLLAAITLVLVVTACGSDETVDTAGDGGAGAGDEDNDASGGGLDGRWTLVGLTIDGADVTMPDTVRPIGMEIDGNAIGGSGGCNSWGGGIGADPDGSVTLTDLAMTEMACEPFELMDFESVYVGALAGVATWSIDGDALTFTSDDAEIRYTAAAPPVDKPLVGTTWRFDTVFSGSGDDGAASSTDQSGPEVTMVVGADSAVLTSTGCSAPVEIPLAHEGDDTAQIIDGNLNAADFVQSPAEACEDPTNMADAVDGILRATGFTISENRLTLHATNDPLVGFIAEG